jgi:methylase of polypeptide subunit release factors
MEGLVSDLAAGFGNRLDHQVDVLLFNPPYVPTEGNEQRRGDYTLLFFFFFFFF